MRRYCEVDSNITIGVLRILTDIGQQRSCRPDHLDPVRNPHFVGAVVPGICYSFHMTKMIAQPSKAAAKTFKIGRRAFDKISAVEGIRLSPEMAKDFGEFDRRGLSAVERRKAIARKYGALRS